MTHIFFDTFFNIVKYLDHEQKDPFSVVRGIGACDGMLISLHLNMIPRQLLIRVLTVSGVSVRRRSLMSRTCLIGRSMQQRNTTSWWQRRLLTTSMMGKLDPLAAWAGSLT